MTSRLIRLLAAFAVMTIGIDADEARAGASADPATPAAVSSDLERRIERLIDRWFAVLEDPTTETTALAGMLAEAPYELVLDGETLRDRSALSAWVSNLRATYSNIEYELAPVHVDPDGGGRYRVHFGFDRHAIDHAGLPHVVRREHDWIIDDAAHAEPVILRIDERKLLFVPGTGPKIVCY